MILDELDIECLISLEVEGKIMPKDGMAAGCREQGIKRLVVFWFGALCNFHPDSDRDLPVEFDPDRVPGFFGITRMEWELSPLLGGRNVALSPSQDLGWNSRLEVPEEGGVQYRRMRKLGSNICWMLHAKPLKSYMDGPVGFSLMIAN